MLLLRVALASPFLAHLRTFPFPLPLKRHCRVTGKLTAQYIGGCLRARVDCLLEQLLAVYRVPYRASPSHYEPTWHDTAAPATSRAVHCLVCKCESHREEGALLLIVLFVVQFKLYLSSKTDYVAVEVHLTYLVSLSAYLFSNSSFYRELALHMNNANLIFGNCSSFMGRPRYQM